MINAGDILALFDAAAADYRFPDLNNGYSYAVDARLHACSDRTRWALVVELVGYDSRALNLSDVVYAFGNCLTRGRQGTENSDYLDRIDNIDDVAEDEEDVYTGGPLSVRGEHIELPPWTVGRGMEVVARQLVPDHRDLLLADETEWRARIPQDLPQVLMLDEWHQPDLYEAVPSASQAYQMIAEVLASADPSRYRPTEPPNTHWSNWPESGEL
jgi:hypothetical protein